MRRLRARPTSSPNTRRARTSIAALHTPCLRRHLPTSLLFQRSYFETDVAAGTEGAPRSWWFGGGTDITPSYVFDQDMKHFHGIYKDVCDKHDPTYYAKYKKWADDYFLIKHRGERRGLGGIFFDDLNVRSRLRRDHTAFSFRLVVSLTSCSRLISHHQTVSNALTPAFCGLFYAGQGPGDPYEVLDGLRRRSGAGVRASCREAQERPVQHPPEGVAADEEGSLR